MTEPVARELYPTPRVLPAEELYSDLAFPEPPPGRPTVVANMVSTVDGKITLRGSAAGIGSRTDLRLMRRLRTHVDALLIGPGTLRAERVGGSVPEAMVAARRARGLPDQPLTVTLSSTLDLPDTPFLRGPGRSIVFTVDGASDSGLEDRATVIRCGAGRVDLARALGILRSDWGVRLLLTESGPNVNEQLVRLGLLDELFWTIAPRLAGGSGIGLMWSPTPAEALLCDLELLSLAEHQGELYSRYRVKRRVDDTSTG